MSTYATYAKVRRYDSDNRIRVVCMLEVWSLCTWLCLTSVCPSVCMSVCLSLSVSCWCDRNRTNEVYTIICQHPPGACSQNNMPHSHKNLVKFVLASHGEDAGHLIGNLVQLFWQHFVTLLSNTWFRINRNADCSHLWAIL